MTLKLRMAGFAFVALMVSAFAAACGEDTSSVIQTAQAENRTINATATAAAAGTPQVSGSPSASQLQATARAATATARAQAGGTTPEPTAPSNGEIIPPEGPALTDADNPTIEIGNAGLFSPNIIKVKAGTTVTWVKPGRTASSTTAVQGQAEQWNSGPMSRPLIPPSAEAPTFSHRFTIPGCYRYQSRESGDTSEGVVCVEE